MLELIVGFVFYFVTTILLMPIMPFIAIGVTAYRSTLPDPAHAFV